MTSVLELSCVTCRFDDGATVVEALREVSLRVDQGEMVAVVGPSGSGKSTVIHLACGLVAPDAGQVRILGEAPPAVRWRRGGATLRSARGYRRWWADRRRTTIGVVHQRLNLVPALRAIDNVALPLRLAGWPASEALALAEEALAQVDASDLAGSWIDRLSMGQQQRIALARATVGGHQLVLADEPTAALDTVGAEQVVGLLARLAESGRAVLLVTHDTRVAAWADRIVVLRDGRTVDEVTSGTEPDHRATAPAGVVP
jgi:putative ABC transport system ATP-binding protein